MSDNSNKTEEQLLGRFRDLLTRSRRSGSFVFTDFLTPAEAALAWRLPDARYEITAFGGAEGTERVMLRFGSAAQLGYEEPFPITLIRISPRAERFAEELAHRDFLGALMNLGIERDVLGDVIVKDGAAFVFAEEHIAPYVTESLDRVRHTSVDCSILTEIPAEAAPKIEEEDLVVSSVRIDAVIARVFHLARGKAKELFARGAVLLDGRECQNESVYLREGALVTVRGFGKFVCRGEKGKTKKDHIVVGIGRYS